MSMNNISKGKIEEELKALANNKAVDLYFILPELLKQGGDAMVDKLTKVANIV